MFEGKRVLAVVPARGGSKGLPRKNLRSLRGAPLVTWPIRAALSAASVDRVIVSTDDPEIGEVARKAGAEFPFVRPVDLATDSASSMPVIRHAVTSMQQRGETFDYVVMLEPTSPLTEADDIDRALAQLHGARAVADSIVGVSRVEAAHPEFDVRIGADGRISPYAAADFSLLRRRQEIEELYFLEGSLYISRSAT
jgi:CMP-N,N'-diacetyllegionaminic acid synthase